MATVDYFIHSGRSLNEGGHSSWSWVDALAGVRPGDRCRLTDMAFSMVRDRCADLGLTVGDEVLCLKDGPSAMSLRGADGRVVQLERHYAWFIQVRPVGAKSDTDTGAARRHRAPSMPAPLEELCEWTPR